jgi:hypothetical protein
MGGDADTAFDIYVSSIVAPENTSLSAISGTAWLGRTLS